MELLIISGASSGIGAELAAQGLAGGSVVATISRRPGPGHHLAADLSDPSNWAMVSSWISDLIASESWDKVSFVHNAGTLEPIGFAGETAAGAYQANVLLNSGAPQVLGAAFIAAVTVAGCQAVLMMISSGAGKNPYMGWSSYCAGKAATDMWVRSAGAEQQARSSRVTVLSVAPGVVDTDMQAQIRSQDEAEFPMVERFQAMQAEGRLLSPAEVATKLLAIVAANDQPNGAVLDIRDSVG